ncbi:MAG: YfiR family protein [Myxococcota bacterium]
MTLPIDAARAQSEDQVKAAFLFNFVRYVEWPEDVFEGKSSKVKICMLGAESFGGVVSQIVSGKSVGDRKVKVESIDSLDSANACHLLYLGEGAPVGLLGGMPELSEAPVFTVSDSEGFAERGGMANFFRADNKVRFEMNPGAAKKARLKISSRLLRLAKVVK